VPPVPDTLLRPLLANTLYLVTTIAPLLAAEAGAARTADQREAASRQHLPAQQLNRLREEIRFRTATGIPAPRLSASNLTRRLARGWDQHDPLLRLAWHPVVVQAIGAMGHRRDLERLRLGDHYPGVFDAAERLALGAAGEQPEPRARRCRELLLVHRPQQGALPETRRHPRGRPTADRDV